ncbi:hypothetical protein A6R68_21905, partial [Neotoma lepida]
FYLIYSSDTKHQIFSVPLALHFPNEHSSIAKRSRRELLAAGDDVNRMRQDPTGPCGPLGYWKKPPTVHFFLGAAFLGLAAVFGFVTFALAALGFTAFALAGLLATFLAFTTFGFLGLLEGFFETAGFLGFFGVFTVFLAAAPAVFLGFLDAPDAFAFTDTLVVVDLPSAFLLILKEPAAPVPLVCTRVPLLTRLLSPSLMRLLFFSTSAFLSAARDTPLRSLEEETACTMSSDTEGPAGFFLGAAVFAGFLVFFAATGFSGAAEAA